MTWKKRVGTIIAAGLLVVAGWSAPQIRLTPFSLPAGGTALAAGVLVNGDADGDQVVNLEDVIIVLQVINAVASKPVSPGADADADGRIGLADALYMLKTIAAVQDELQPVIDAYLAAVPIERTAADSAAPELERTFYLNGDIGPALKMPTITFSASGIDFAVHLGSYTPVDSPAEAIAAVRVLFYDGVLSEWGYGVNQDDQDAFLTAAPHGNGYSATYSLFVDGLEQVSDGTRKSLADVNPAKGFLLHVMTAAGSEFLVGSGNSVRLPALAGSGRMPAMDDFQDRADQVAALPVAEGACPCPTVDMLADLQQAFSSTGVPLTGDHLVDKGFSPVFSCGDTFKTLIRLGSDLEVLESYQKLGDRIRTGDFRAVEPAGYFRGAAYLMQLYFWSWWDPAAGMCKCQFSWHLVEVQTARVLGSRTVIKNCGELQADFGAMLAEIETGLDAEMFMLSDADFAIPDCEDGNQCTWDAYDLKTGQCVHRVKAASPAAPCDDGNPCTLNDACSNGSCIGTPKTCNDFNPCTAESCDPADGQCKTDGPLPDGTPCDDGDAVTENDMCSAGACTGTINPDNPLPDVPRATGAPYFSPDTVSGSFEATTVFIPVTPDTRLVAIRLYDTDGAMIAMSSGPVAAGTELAQVQTPGFYASEGALYLEFYVYAGQFGGAYSLYSRDTSGSGSYTVFQDDDAEHTLQRLSDIPVAWLTVQGP